MKAEELRKMLVANGYENTFVLDNPDLSNAVIGITEDARLVYSYSRMIDCLFESGNFTVEEAVEFVSVETFGTIDCIEQNKPIVVYEFYGDAGLADQLKED
jgi:hypothetical protein